MKEKEKFKILIIIPMAIVELILLGINWIVALISPSLGNKMIKWHMRVLPDEEWYLE